MTLQVGVKILLKDSAGKYLLLRRNEEKYKGVKGAWDIPGGRIEPGIPLIDNLCREVKEETNLELIGQPQLIAAQDILRKDKHVVRLTYTGHATGEIRLDTSENIDYRWLTLKKIKKTEDLDIYLREILGKI